MPHFDTTQWTLIMQAGNPDASHRGAAFEALCRSYWKPVHTFTQQIVGCHQDAEDFTQGFFQYLIEHDLPAGLSPTKGRFRTWLLAVLKNFLASQHRYQTRQKRGGTVLETLTLDEAHHELVDPAHPDAVFEKEWARSVLANSLERLRTDCEQTGHTRRFQVLHGSLFDLEKGEGATLEQATALGISHNAARITLSRLRQRFGELLKSEISRLVETPAEVDQEIAHLVRVLRGL